MLKEANCLLVVAEQASLRASLARLARPLGYCIEIASSEKRARQLTSQGQFAAAVAVSMGFSARESAFLRDLQAAVPRLAILVNSEREGKRLAASFPEALVCRSEPLEDEKLLAFFRAAPPAASAGTPERLHFAGCALDVKGRIFADAAQREVPLTRGEFALLLAFVRDVGRVLSRAQLRSAIDGGSVESYDRSIDMLVARLRRKIEPNPARPQFILTTPGVGYKFVPEVRHGERVSATTFGLKDQSQVPGVGEVPRAERHRVTLLSCEILGFAELAAKLDPEELDRTIAPIWTTCAEIIARFGGMIVRTLGATALAYFGYPKAHEAHAANAVRAGFELLHTIRKIKVGPLLVKIDQMTR